MNTRPIKPEAVLSWQQEIATAFTDFTELFDFLQLDRETLPYSTAADNPFPMRVPRNYAARMEKGNPWDPLLLQVLPRHAENTQFPGFHPDPVGDLDAEQVPGLLQKYRHRALIITTGACAVHCRYCFRRNFPYQETSALGQNLARALTWLRSHPEIHEVILSGGDPLSLSDRRLLEWLDALSELKQLQRLRIHTRVPVVIPQRVTPAFVAWLKTSQKPIALVLHINHPHELHSELQQALVQLRAPKVTLFNQAVLLKGVNDRANVLIDLSELLFAHGVIPYYLHQLDRVAGSAHFEVSDHDARELHAQMAAALPGYLVPRLVREIAGAANKVQV